MLGHLRWALLAWFPHAVAAQTTPLVAFTAQQWGNHVVLSFTLRAGMQCWDVQIQRATDGLPFQTIGIIPGVCGSSSSEETYRFVDSMPVPNATNYYRIDLGWAGLSQSVSVYFAWIPPGSMHYYWLSTQAILILLPEEFPLSTFLYVIDMCGRQQMLGTATARRLVVHLDNLLPGTYVLHAKDQKGNTASARLLIP